MRRRSMSLLASGALLLTACGSAATAPQAAQSTDAPASSAPTASADSDSSEATVATEPSASSVAQSEQSDQAETVTTQPAPASTEPEPDTEPDAEPAADARPDDGCSTDNSPTEPDVADGPAPAIGVRAASSANALPDLAVRRINCDGGWVNLKNEIPADLPLLVWFWAPH